MPILKKRYSKKNNLKFPTEEKIKYVGEEEVSCGR